jgi:hypothetical protein
MKTSYSSVFRASSTPCARTTSSSSSSSSSRAVTPRSPSVSAPSSVVECGRRRATAAGRDRERVRSIDHDIDRSRSTSITSTIDIDRDIDIDIDIDIDRVIDIDIDRVVVVVVGCASTGRDAGARRVEGVRTCGVLDPVSDRPHRPTDRSTASWIASSSSSSSVDGARARQWWVR